MDGIHGEDLLPDSYEFVTLRPCCYILMTSQ